MKLLTMLRHASASRHLRSAMLVLMLLAIPPAQARKSGSPFPIRPRCPVATVARVSLPRSVRPACRFAAGRGDPRRQNGARQAKVITRHPDGSIRRVMLRRPRRDAAARRQQRHLPSRQIGNSAIRTSPHQPFPLIDGQVVFGWTTSNCAARTAFCWRRLSRSARNSARRKPLSGVLDCGPQFTWLRYDRPGSQWNRQWDVQVFRTGELRLVHRIQAKPRGDHWTPDFGWKLTAPGAQVSDLPKGAAHMLAAIPTHALPTRKTQTCSGRITLSDGTPACVTNPLALRQNRGTFEVNRTTDAIIVRSSRIEPVKKIETQGLMIQEGAWRFSELAIAPLDKAEFAARLDAPVYTSHADWHAYDAVYRTGAPLKVKHPVLRDCVEKMVFALQDMQMKGDDLGSMPWSWDSAANHAQLQVSRPPEPLSVCLGRLVPRRRSEDARRGTRLVPELFRPRNVLGSEPEVLRRLPPRERVA